MTVRPRGAFVEDHFRWISVNIQEEAAAIVVVVVLSVMPALGCKLPEIPPGILAVRHKDCAIR